MNKTNLLPPLSAVYLVWGTTRKFADSSTIDSFDSSIKPFFENLIKEADKNDLEKQYLSQAYTILMASMRNVIIIYKGRQLNYSENKLIREAYLDSLKSELNITSQLKDLLKSLPAITIGGASGLVIADLKIKTSGTLNQLSYALLFAIAGYLARYFYMRFTSVKKQKNFIRQDYETTIYYNHYLIRMEEVMINLYRRMEELHEDMFGQKYNDDSKKEELIKKMFHEIQPVHCPLLDQHINSRKITPDRWHMCEVGLPLSENCKYYRKKRKFKLFNFVQRMISV
jgi:hypothetical protein